MTAILIVSILAGNLVLWRYGRTIRGRFTRACQWLHAWIVVYDGIIRGEWLSEPELYEETEDELPDNRIRQQWRDDASPQGRYGE
jgi:hypothetical protein